MSSSAVLFPASARMFLCNWYMAWIPGELLSVATVEAPVPFLGPLFITEMVGATHNERVIVDVLDLGDVKHLHPLAVECCYLRRIEPVSVYS